MGEVIQINKYDALNPAIMRDVMQYPAEKNLVYEIDQLKPNHHLFEINPGEGLIQPAEVVKSDLVIKLNGVKAVRQEIKTKPGCIYMPSLNAENAERKFKKKFKLK